MLARARGLRRAAGQVADPVPPREDGLGSHPLQVGLVELLQREQREVVVGAPPGSATCPARRSPTRVSLDAALRCPLVFLSPLVALITCNLLLSARSCCKCVAAGTGRRLAWRLRSKGAPMPTAPVRKAFIAGLGSESSRQIDPRRQSSLDVLSGRAHSPPARLGQTSADVVWATFGRHKRWGGRLESKRWGGRPECPQNRPRMDPAHTLACGAEVRKERVSAVKSG